MTKKSSSYYPILEIPREEPKPHCLEGFANDRMLLTAVDQLLSVPMDEFNTVLEATRKIIEARDAKSCDDTRLALEIDHASCFISDEALYMHHMTVSRYARSQI